MDYEMIKLLEEMKLDEDFSELSIEELIEIAEYSME